MQSDIVQFRDVTQQIYDVDRPLRALCLQLRVVIRAKRYFVQDGAIVPEVASHC